MQTFYLLSLGPKIKNMIKHVSTILMAILTQVDTSTKIQKQKKHSDGLTPTINLPALDLSDRRKLWKFMFPIS
jgi:hypothetical protein